MHRKTRGDRIRLQSHVIGAIYVQGVKLAFHVPAIVGVCAVADRRATAVRSGSFSHANRHPDLLRLSKEVEQVFTSYTESILYYLVYLPT